MHEGDSWSREIDYNTLPGTAAFFGVVVFGWQDNAVPDSL